MTGVDAESDGRLVVCLVLSNNWSIEERVKPLIKANNLVSLLLAVAYTIAGATRVK